MAVQNSLSPTVDILNQDTGKVITHYSENADRVVNLSQTSIVRINASPETVNFYERQGNDLIVHMKDGTTVRYQNFFHLDAEGQHSELIFEDDKGVHHALFPFASEAGPAVAEAITPTMADTTLGALTGAEGLTTLQALGGIAAIGGIAGVAIAASNSGGGGGGNDDNNNGGGDNGGGDNGGGDNGGGDNGGGDNGGGDNGGGETPDPAEIALDPLTDDNILNGSEVLQNQVISGTVDAANAGRTITVTLNGNTYTGVVGADGSWSVTLPASALQALPQGLNTITVTLVDVNGNTVNQTVDINVDTVAPTLQLTPFTDGVLGGEQAATTQILRGSTGVAEEGQTVTVTLNGKTYTATVDANGNWQTTVPAADLQGLADGNYEVTATAQQGGVSDSHTLTVIINNLPDTTIDPLFTDGTLSQAEAGVDQVLTGSTGVAGAGQSVTVTLNGQAYQGTVDANGNWSVTLPSGALDSLTGNDSPVPLQIVVRDAAGNSQTTTTDFIVDVDAPTLTINPFAQDDALNITEAGQAQAFSGVATGAAQGDAIVVTLNGKTYNTTVTGANGEWSVNIPAADLQALPNGQAQFSAR
ncbi:Ig-like domain-containing protein [Cronobacter sakazakii]|uniref:Ig-like domain-containing protein n=1 Tax=Cronobacter sakazakii TaxID=28141 RepID=UPI001EFEED6B|nr:Ig-like domain-containing protein [Cronobacter sakazakii]